MVLKWNLGSACSLRGDGPTVGNVANVEVVSTQLLCISTNLSQHEDDTVVG